MTNLVEFDVRFITRKKLDETLQMDIDTEVKNIFRMAGLDDIEKRVRNKVAVWFKAPNGKSWVFKSKPGYEHI